MKTNQNGLENPPVLEWHKEAAANIHETPLPTASQFLDINECISVRLDRLAAIIARHDPHAAPAINTNVRLFDLVRFMRRELHQAELITDEEYTWLCAESPMASSKHVGSPSPRRLEDYDDLRKQHAALCAIGITPPQSTKGRKGSK